MWRPRLWAVLDTARSPSIFKLIDRSTASRWALFPDAESQGLERDCPYLVAIHEDEDLLKTVLRRGWGESSCVASSWVDSEPRLRLRGARVNCNLLRASESTCIYKCMQYLIRIL